MKQLSRYGVFRIDPNYCYKSVQLRSISLGEIAWEEILINAINMIQL